MTDSDAARPAPARGIERVSRRAVPAMPSATVAVSKMSATVPVALVVYQSGLGPEEPAASTWLAASGNTSWAELTS